MLPYYLRGARGLPSLVRSALADRPEEVVDHVLPPRVVLRGVHDHLCPPDWAARLGAVRELPGAHNTPYTHPQETSRALRALV